MQDREEADLGTEVFGIGGKKLALCRTLLGAPAPQKVSVEKLGEHKRKLCPACKIGHLVLLRLIPRLDSS